MKNKLLAEAARINKNQKFSQGYTGTGTGALTYEMTSDNKDTTAISLGMNHRF